MAREDTPLDQETFDRVLAEELDRGRAGRPLLGVHAQHLDARLLVAVVDGVARHHLRDRQAGAVALGLQAHEPVADARQRREHDAVRDLDPTQGPALRQPPHNTSLEGVRPTIRSFDAPPNERMVGLTPYWFFSWMRRRPVRVRRRWIFWPYGEVS